MAALTTGPSIESQCGGISVHSFLTDTGEHALGGGNPHLESFIRLIPTEPPLLMVLAPELLHVSCSVARGIAWNRRPDSVASGRGGWRVAASPDERAARVVNYLGDSLFGSLYYGRYR